MSRLLLKPRKKTSNSEPTNTKDAEGVSTLRASRSPVGKEGHQAALENGIMVNQKPADT
ncbi:hypothetical protein FOPG_20218 [Fusarium oxysporum f. sp. conglutinans race 2 54008]|uniref:Uncharacterized protein n=1 Tax=Fusarium oxysporum f. sp. conglutinans race 2 54008 TaxID=1089457 RepID=X0GJM3_FUSOX|nr:hypothetical protein FOPG_20218 [Fusarium oxysporum f. sp. conglutinans race 2 54008]